MAFNTTRWAICLLLLISVLPSVFGLYFYLEGSEQKCFTEELPKETTVTGTFRAEEWDEDQQKFVDNKSLGIEVLVEELPASNRVYNQKMQNKGQFKFTSAESGEHAICFYTATSGWFSSAKTRLHLDLQIHDVFEADNEVPEDSLSDLAQRVRDLNHKLSEIRREQSYQRDLEREFRDKSEATNAHIVTWTVVQVVILGVTCAWQMRHLKGFFESKKLV